MTRRNNKVRIIIFSKQTNKSKPIIKKLNHNNNKRMGTPNYLNCILINILFIYYKTNHDDLGKTRKK